MLSKKMLRWRLLGAASAIAIGLSTPVVLHPRTMLAPNDAACGEGEDATYCCPQPGHICIALPEPLEDYQFDTIPFPGCIPA